LVALAVAAAVCLDLQAFLASLVLRRASASPWVWVALLRPRALAQAVACQK